MIGHFNIGDILLQDEQYELAVKELQIALLLARKKKIPWMELGAGLAFVEAKIEMLQLENADEEINSLKPIIAKQASQSARGQEFALLARLYWRQNLLDQAKDYFERAFQLLNTEDSQYARARTLLAFAGFKTDLKQVAEARSALQNAKDIFTKRNNQLGLRAVEKALLNIQNK
jgi:tetratricopeptide (TPR) repeat protein